MNLEDLLTVLTKMAHEVEGSDGLPIAICTTAGMDLGDVGRVSVFESDYHREGAVYLECVPSKVEPE